MIRELEESMDQIIELDRTHTYLLILSDALTIRLDNLQQRQMKILCHG